MLLDLFLWLAMLSVLLILAFVVILKGFSQTNRQSRQVQEHQSINSYQLKDDVNNDI